MEMDSKESCNSDKEDSQHTVSSATSSPPPPRPIPDNATNKTVGESELTQVPAEMKDRSGGKLLNAGIQHKNASPPASPKLENENKISTCDSNKNSQSPLTPAETYDNKSQSSVLSSSPNASTSDSAAEGATVNAEAKDNDTNSPEEKSTLDQAQIAISSAETQIIPSDGVRTEQLSPCAEHSPGEQTAAASATLADNCVPQPINVVRNGTIPNAGKPLLSTMSKKLEKSVRSRSRKQKTPSVAMYESEVNI